jgi:hypothetical protein
MSASSYPISYLAMVLFGLSAMLDTGKHDDITFDEVKRQSSSGNLLKFLRERNGGSFASGITDGDPAFGEWYEAQIADNCKAMDGRERRKYAIQNRGLCLLISYTAEILQSSYVAPTVH